MSVDTVELVEDPAYYPPDEQEVEDNADIETEEFYPVEYSISSYGADYPVDGLVKRIKAGTIYIPPFQRSYVWNIYRASRFIESLLLGLPVPAIFLSKELSSNKLLVIDGQQRLRTLQYFYDGVFEPSGQRFALRGVHPRFSGRTYNTIDADDRIRLDDSILHAIIVKQEEPNAEHEGAYGPTSAYHIFERLNTGGVLLQPQEIRSCILHGSFVKLLDELNQNPDWRSLFGKVSTRMRDRELILRFFALLHCADQYTKPMKDFLTRFAAEYREIENKAATEFIQIFAETVKAIRSGVGHRAFKPKKAVNAALCDSVMVGVARRIRSGPISNEAALAGAYSTLLAQIPFTEAISSGTTDEANVATRLRLATEAFVGVP